jgi:hypothetical protein
MAKFFYSASADFGKIDLIVLQWLEKLPDTYWVLIEFSAQHRNCDYLILGDATIALLEVKSYRIAVQGNSNNHWSSLATGRKLAVKDSRSNPVGQATKIAETLQLYLQQSFRKIFGYYNPNQKEHLKVFPFVVLPNEGNKIQSDHDWCWISQGEKEFREQFDKRTYFELRLKAAHLQRIVDLFQLERVTDLKKLRPTGIPSTITQSNKDLQLVLPTPQTMPRAWVRIVDQATTEPGVIEEYELIEPVTKIGRGSDCHIWLGSTKISHQHCQIIFTNNAFLLQDLGSTNRTFYQGRELESYVATPLKSRTTFKLAEQIVEITFFQD